MEETLRVKGDNTYKVPHMGKDKLSSEGKLPISIKCDLSAMVTA